MSVTVDYSSSVSRVKEIYDLIERNQKKLLTISEAQIDDEEKKTTLTVKKKKKKKN